MPYNQPINQRVLFMKIVQTKLLLLASALFVVSSCDCIKKMGKTEEKVVVTHEQVANETTENTLVADNDMETTEVKLETTESTEPAVVEEPKDQVFTPEHEEHQENTDTSTPSAD